MRDRNSTMTETFIATRWIDIEFEARDWADAEAHCEAARLKNLRRKEKEKGKSDECDNKSERNDMGLEPPPQRVVCGQPRP